MRVLAYGIARSHRFNDRLAKIFRMWTRETNAVNSGNSIDGTQ